MKAAAAVLAALAFFGLLYWLQVHDDVKTRGHVDYSEVTIDYKGHPPLYCVGYEHGVSCDWQRWHQETAR